jgi:hypothetical protein
VSYLGDTTMWTVPGTAAAASTYILLNTQFPRDALLRGFDLFTSTLTTAFTIRIVSFTECGLAPNQTSCLALFRNATYNNYSYQPSVHFKETFNITKLGYIVFNLSELKVIRAGSMVLLDLHNGSIGLSESRDTDDFEIQFSQNVTGASFSLIKRISRQSQSGMLKVKLRPLVDDTYYIHSISLSVILNEPGVFHFQVTFFNQTYRTTGSFEVTIVEG